MSECQVELFEKKVAEYFVIMQKKCNFAVADRHAEALVWGNARWDAET